MIDTPDPLGQLAADLDLLAQQQNASLRDVSPPEALVTDLHGFPAGVGEEVVDSVTGLTGTVLGYGVAQVKTD